MDEEGASDLGSTQVLFGGRVPFWSATARMWPKGQDASGSILGLDGHAPERPNRPQVVAVPADAEGACRLVGLGCLGSRSTGVVARNLRRLAKGRRVAWKCAKLDGCGESQFHRPRGECRWGLPNVPPPHAASSPGRIATFRETCRSPRPLCGTPKWSVATQARQTPKCAAHLSSQDGLLPNAGKKPVDGVHLPSTMCRILARPPQIRDLFPSALTCAKFHGGCRRPS